MKNKIFTRIIITTLLVTFLTFSVGKVTRVSAVGTTAAIAGTAFILTGAVYLSYVALTQGEMIIPSAEELHDWLGGIGRKVSQYPSGAAAYQDIYQDLVRSPFGNVIDGVWTWTQDRIKSFVNDFADTRIINDIVTYEEFVDVSQIPTNTFPYTFTFQSIPHVIISLGHTYTFAEYAQAYNAIFTELTGSNIIYKFSDNYSILSSDITNPVRNYMRSDGKYIAQQYYDNSWHNITLINAVTGHVIENNIEFELVPYFSPPNYGVGSFNYPVASVLDYPLFPQERIYDSRTDEYIDLIPVNSTEIRSPSWNDPDNDNRPIIPWVPLPQLPVNVTPPTGYVNPQWGFNLQDLLDKLEDFAGQLIDIGVIASLINGFAGLHGDEYYIEYNDGDTNYYNYYQPTIYDDDTKYITYNINVSEQEDSLPVDLNTISLYSQNRYLEQIKQSAINGSSIVRDLAVFWYDVDPEVTYIALGVCILILLGAFTGKLGHS